MSERSTIIKIAAFLGNSISESGSIFEEFSTEFLGVDLPASVTQNQGVLDALGIGKRAANDLKSAVIELESLAVDASAIDIGIKFTLYGEALREYFFAINTLIQAVDNAIVSSGLSGNTLGAVNDIKDRFRKLFTDYIVVTALEFLSPQLLLILKLLGLVDWGFTSLAPGSGDDGVSNSYVKKELQLYKIKNLITDPLSHFIDTIGWGHDDFDPEPFFRIFAQFMRRDEAFILDEIDGDPRFTYGIFSIRRLSTETPPALRIDLIADLQDTEKVTRNIGDALRFNIEANYGYQGGASVLLRPPVDVSLIPNIGEVSGGLKMFIDRQESARPFNIINAGNFTLSVDDTPFGIGLDAYWDIAAGKATINPLVFAKISRGIIELDTSEGDGFVSNLLSGSEINGNFDLGFEWSGHDGLRITASGGIEIMLPLHVNLGIIEINNLYIALQIKETGTLSLETSAEFSGNLGPVSATVERLGAVTNLTLPENNESETGLFNIDVDFKHPSGVGLSVDAGVVKGGGYLYFDFDREEYAGALELVFSEWIALKAVGLITTRLPDGSKGFSMVIIISVEFGSGLQLGFGFTLLGVGGMLGINRTVNIDAMSAGVRSGAIENVMFPENVVANAPKIISDLRQFFPALNDQFLIGPMAKIGYGTPTLMSLSLGVIIEFPDVNITILGILKVALPTEEASVIKLQVNFLGRIEPSNNLLWFHAFLFDSRILFITLEGGMGLLVNWGDDSNFVVSVGGFHPRFSPPPLPFPDIPRIAVNILNESMARIRIEGYFAVTSNTVQFGARAELFFGFSAINVEGHLGFDALFQFNPFYFIFEFSLGLSVKVFGFGLFSIDVSGLLEGPAKWHIEGTAKWKITWFGPTIRININETWGEEKQTELPPIEAFPLLEREFTAITNWEAVVPKQSSLLVALRKLGDAESEPDSEDMDTRPLVLHPVGTLRISQRKIPLKLKLDKIGSQQPSDVNEFTVTANLGGGGSLALDNVREKFARGEFQELDKATKLSTPAFEKYESGLTVSADGDELQTSMAVKRIIRYETIIIDNLFKRKAIAFFKQLQLLFSTVFATLFSHFLKGNAVTKSTLSFKQQRQMQPNKEVIAIKANEYSVAFNDTNKPVDTQTAQFKSHAEATDYLRRQHGMSAKSAQSMHVIPNTEVNTAA